MPITRQSYFLPTQITGCSLWLDAADLSSFTLSGSSVTQWNDKSGNGWNVSQATSGKRPTLVTNSLNGLPGLNFINASSQHLDTAIQSSLNSLTGLSLFYVLKPTWNIGDPVQNPAFFGIRAPGGGVTIFNYYFINDYSGTAMFNGAPITSHTGSSVTSAIGKNVVSLYCSTNNNGTDIAYLNGNLTGDTITSASFGSGTNLPIIIGGDNYDPYENWQGLIYEVVFFTRVLTSIERQQVEAYLAQKWGLTGSLPATHPGLQKIIHRNLQTTFTKKQYFTAFSPKQIAGCSHWFDATDSSTIILSSGSLTQWNDKSGNGRNLTAVSGFANATVSSAYQNGLNVFNFSGNGLYRTDLGNVSYPLDVFIVVALKSLTNHVDVLGMGDTAVDNFNSLTFAESAASRWHNGSSFGNRQTISTSNETSLSFLLIQWSIANGNYLLRRNGTQLVQASQTYSFSYPASSAFQIGFRHTNINAANFSGYIGEIVVFNNQIGTTDRQNVESYLAQKWGLVSSLAAGHLNETFPAGSPTAIQPFVSRIRPALTNIAKATGGIITNVGGRRFHTFINNGTFSIVSAMPGKIFEVFAIGGGGGGGGFEGGGGGGGGLVTYTSSLSVGNYSITIGTGGTGGTASSVAGGNGTSTLFSSLVTAIGGGGGGSSFGGSPANGGCGGGGAYNQSYGTGSQGFNGAVASPSLYWGGGGGGTSASATNNNGGAGTLYYGSYYGGGGGGGGNQGPNGTGGIGGGGDGGGSGTPSVQYITPAPVAGAANTGGGGGGHGYNGTTGAIGGTGICIVSYIYP